MAFEEKLVTVTLVAGADLSGSQYKFVKLDANDDAVLCDTAGEQAYGVLQNDPASGEEATVAIGGISKVHGAAALSINDDIATDANGEAVAASTGNIILGKCRASTTNADEIGSVDFRSHLGTA